MLVCIIKESFIVVLILLLLELRNIEYISRTSVKLDMLEPFGVVIDKSRADIYPSGVGV